MSNNQKQVGYNFGTFKGVFVPNILTILGVIMYLRFGWVLGNVGLVKTIVIVTISTSITLITAFSLAALATNMKVKGGGAYYIISRSLGLEVGAAVGLPLFIAQALSISFYIAGFTEVLHSLFPEYSYQLIGVVSLLSLALLAYFSANLALKTQYLVLAIIVLSLVSFFMGSAENIASLTTKPIEAKSFWLVFAVFFPAVTGITAGLSLSGDLKNPARSIPLGTFWAIGISYVIYIVIPIFLSIKIKDSQILIANLSIMQMMAKYEILIILGICGATISSAMGSLLGAPRTLKALADDGVLPKFIGRVYGRNKDPRIATLISIGIGLAGFLLGDLNIIAPILSMFFLITYSLLNFAAGFETLIGSPSFRPSFKVYWETGIVGFIVCFLVMLMINAGATMIAIAIAILTFILVQRKNITRHWGDISYGMMMIGLSFIIRKLEKVKPNVRSWSPNVLAVISSIKDDQNFVKLASAITSHKGLLSLCLIMKQRVDSRERLNNLKESMRNYLNKQETPAIVNISYAKNVLNGTVDLVKTYGFGPVTANTIVLKGLYDEQNLEAFMMNFHHAYVRQHNVLIVKNYQGEVIANNEPIINIFWGGHRKNASFMLAIALLIKDNDFWQDAQINLISFVEKEEEQEKFKNLLTDFSNNSRVNVDVIVDIYQAGELINKIEEYAQKASLNFVGLPGYSEQENAEDYLVKMKNFLIQVQSVNAVVLSLANQDVDFQDIYK
jgi:amino acid transporter